MKLAALRANSRVCTRKLANSDRRKYFFLMVFPCFHFRLGYKCCHIINDYLIKLYRLLSVRRKHKPSVKQSVDKNRSNRFLTSAIRSHICTRFGRYLHSKTPSRIISWFSICQTSDWWMVYKTKWTRAWPFQLSFDKIKLLLSSLAIHWFVMDSGYLPCVSEVR